MNKRATRVGMISASLMVTVITIMAQTALAANHNVTGTGSTYIDRFGCDANVPNGPPGSLDVANGDSVTIHYNYTYWDNRPQGYPRAEHIFIQTVLYGGGGRTEAHYHNTSGSELGGGSIQWTVYNVQTGTSIWVGWYANITCGSSPQCHDTDSKEGYINLI
jgi:hypothetical protein